MRRGDDEYDGKESRILYVVTRPFGMVSLTHTYDLYIFERQLTTLGK